MRAVVCAVALVWTLRALATAPETAVRVWEDSLDLPTYAEGPPNPNPPFDLSSFTRFNYPVTLQNRADARHRYYWWTNAAVEVWDDSRLVYPTEFMATHGFTRVQRWPIDESGRDLSVIRNQTAGPVSLFTYGTREPFVGVYHPQTASGTVHIASPGELPTHKVWSWGADADALEWRRALSDNNSAYVELQAGLFRNQETYAFLEPPETVRFTEYWLPGHDIGGRTRVTTDG